MRKVILATTLAIAIAGEAAACTTFCSRGVFGRNYDFETGEGMLVVNKRGLRKTSMTSTPANWLARFGSVTFNQFGRDFPMDGMNEEGLVVALMWLDGTRYPTADQRPTVGVLEWIQYQLDTASTVDEVLANTEKIRIRQGGTPLHYLVADRHGDTASIEFLDGLLVVHRGETMSAPVLANDTYASSLAWLERMERERRNPGSSSSLDRFARAALMLRSVTGDPVADTFSILASVAQPNWTRWSVAYDMQNRKLHYKSLANATERSVSLASFDFGCSMPTLTLALDEGSGDVSARFTPYTFESNRALLGHSYANTSFLSATSSTELDATARHPEKATCQTATRRRAAE